MDDYVIRAMAKWPDVPGVYGWLSLDCRGDWRIKGERLGHRKAVAFINRNYAADGSGCWYFQNGPQRVYVRLEYTPWVFRLSASDELNTHPAEGVESVEGVFLDHQGNLLLNTAKGIGLMDDRDLDALSAHLDMIQGGADAQRVEAAITETQAGRPRNLVLNWRGRSWGVGHVKRAAVASHFGFNPNPNGENGTS
ncbi:MAG: DUF2946 family protein [Gammaproteobacteria bacterium]|nr:DUF2946 family protein [Gammaproteobacteria bacterium]